MKANSSRNGIAFDCQTWRNRKMRILASTRSTPGEGKMWPRTDLLDLFGVLHPIMQAPMSGYGGPALLATVSNVGGLGGRHSGRVIELAHGGARVGLMGAVPATVLIAGGTATGVMPRALVEREIAYQGLT